MNAPEDETLDNRIEKALGGAAKEFDFEAFKHRYSDQVKQYRSQFQGGMRRSARFPTRLGLIAKLTVAAMLLVGLGLLLQNGHRREGQAQVVESRYPSSMMSVLELNRAYREGGLDAIDEQYERAFAKLGPRTSSMAWSTLSIENL